MNSKNKARRILSEAISDLHTEAKTNNINLTPTIVSLKSLYSYLRDMNPGTVITAGDNENPVLYSPYSVSVFHIDEDPENIEDQYIFWNSYMEVERIPGYQTKVGIMKDLSSDSGWKTVIGWGNFEECSEKQLPLEDLKKGYVTVQAIPLESFDVGVRIVTRRLSELNTDVTPDPAPEEVILTP